MSPNNTNKQKYNVFIIFHKSKAHQPLGLCERAIGCLWPLDDVLSSGLCGKEGGPTSCDKLNRSENYLLLGFLLGMPSQSVLLLVRQSVTQDNCSISVSYPSSSKVK